MTPREGPDASAMQAAARPTRAAWRPLARRVVAALLLVASLLAGAMWTTGAVTRSTSTQEQAFPATGIDTLRIDGGAGPVTIVVVDRGDVVVTTRLTDSALGRITSRRAVSGNTLRITTRCDRRCLASKAGSRWWIRLDGGNTEVERSASRLDGRQEAPAKSGDLLGEGVQGGLVGETEHPVRVDRDVFARGVGTDPQPVGVA